MHSWLLKQVINSFPMFYTVTISIDKNIKGFRYIDIMSSWSGWGDFITKTSLANVASFLLVIGLMAYGIIEGKEEIVMLAGGWGGGYLFGVSSNNK